MDAAQSGCSRCTEVLSPFSGPVHGVGHALPELSRRTTPKRHGETTPSARREPTPAGFGALEVADTQLGQNAIVPAPVVTLHGVAMGSQIPHRVSRTTPTSTVEVGIIISTGDLEGRDASIEIDATATLQGTAPPPRRAVEARRQSLATSTLVGAAASLERARSDAVFAVPSSRRLLQTARHPAVADGLAVQISALNARVDNRAGDVGSTTRVGMARVAIAADCSQPATDQGLPQPDIPHAVDVSALFYRVDADLPGRMTALAATSAPVARRQAKRVPEQPRLPSTKSIAVYSLLTLLLAALVWGCVRLVMKS